MKIDKEDFLNMLTNITQEQINKIIEEKGKSPKLISPIVFISNKKILS